MHSDPIIEKIRDKLQAIDPAKQTTVLVFQFNFKNADGSPLKSYVLNMKELRIYEGTVENPDGEITVEDEDFFLWATKQVPYDHLKEKVKISGNLEAVQKLMDKFHQP